MACTPGARGHRGSATARTEKAAPMDAGWRVTGAPRWRKSVCLRHRAGGSGTHRAFPPMSDTPPDRLALDPRSPYHDIEAINRGVGVRFNGEERDNVEEYCVSEGWIRVQVGRARDRRGNPMTIKIKGQVEPYYLT